MASDNINEVGKFIKDTSRRTNKALNRYKPDVPRVERVRDVFDPDNSFTMSFDMKPGEDQILLDLNFNKPPPTGTCTSDCLISNCEQFLLTVGNHFITLQHPYNTGSLRIFDNNVFVASSNVDETDRLAGQLSVQGLSGEGVTIVCYTYADPSCDFPDILGPNCPPSHSNLYTGLTTVFSDRFDRSMVDQEITQIQTSGGCGYWTGTVSGGEGFGFLSNAVAHLENDRIASDQWEILVAGTIFNNNFHFNFGSVTDAQGSNPLEGAFGASIDYSNIIPNPTQLSISFPYKLTFQDGDGFGGLLPYNGDYGFGTYNKVINNFTKFTDWVAEDQPSINGGILFFMRFVQVVPGGWYFKAWRAKETEPVDWDMQATIFDIRTDAHNTVPPYISLEAIYGTLWKMTATMATINAFSIWSNPGQGYANAGSLSSHTLSFCRQVPDDGFTRFGFCTPLGTPSTVSSIEGGANWNPSYLVWFSWPSFVDGPGIVESGTQVTAKYIFDGKPIGCTVKGQFAITSYLGPSRTFGATFISLPVGNPPVVGESYFGNIVGGGTAGGYNDINLEWHDFEIHLPVNIDEDGNYAAQWTVGLTLSPDTIVATLPRYEPPFLFANNTPIGVDVRNVSYLPDGVLDCTTGNICPDNADAFDARCADVNNAEINLPYFCTSLAESVNAVHSELILDGDNKEVWVERNQGVDISSTLGETTVLYRAAGVTTDGSDGRCKRQSQATFNGVTTNTHVNEAWIKYPTIFDCNVPSEAYLEFFWPKVPDPWFAPNTSTTQNPNAEIFLGGNDGGPLLFFWQYNNPPDTGFEIIGTEDNNSYPLPLILNNWTSIRMRTEDNRFKVKFWPTDSPEPNSWSYDVDATNDLPLTSFGFYGDADNFGDDSVYFKYRNISIHPIGGI